MVAADLLNYYYLDVRCHRYILTQSSNNPTIFGDNLSIVNIYKPFLENQDGVILHLECFQLCISDVIDMFKIEVPICALILAKIGQILKTWHQFLGIQDGVYRHLEKYTSG